MDMLREAEGLLDGEQHEYDVSVSLLALQSRHMRSCWRVLISLSLSLSFSVFAFSFCPSNSFFFLYS